MQIPQCCMSITSFLFLAEMRAPILLCLAGLSNGFYVPGVAPIDFKRSEQVEIRAVKMTSSKTQLPYEYYTLPFCLPSEGVNYQSLNLGEVLRGDRLVLTSSSSFHRFFKNRQHGIRCKNGWKSKLQGHVYIWTEGRRRWKDHPKSQRRLFCPSSCGQLASCDSMGAWWWSRSGTNRTQRLNFSMLFSMNMATSLDFLTPTATPISTTSWLSILNTVVLRMTETLRFTELWVLMFSLTLF